jgi:hypothetical protein
MFKNFINLSLVTVLIISSFLGNTVFGAVASQAKPNYTAKCQLNSELITYSKCMKDLAGIPATRDEFCQPSKGILTDQECTDTYNEYLKYKKNPDNGTPFSFEIGKLCDKVNGSNSKDKKNCRAYGVKEPAKMCTIYTKVPKGDINKMKKSAYTKFQKIFNYNEECKELVGKITNNPYTKQIAPQPKSTALATNPTTTNIPNPVSPINGTKLPSSGELTANNGNCGLENTIKLNPKDIKSLCDVCVAVTNNTVDKTKTNFKRCGNYAKTSEAWFAASKIPNVRQVENTKKSIAYRDGFCTYVVKSSKGSTGYIKFSASDLKVFEENCKKQTTNR